MRACLFLSLMILLSSCVWRSTSACLAQEARPVGESDASLATSITPEMWFYQQERARYEDPRAAVRRRAEFRATQRQNRIAALHWFGMSNSRPTSNASGWYTMSPTWVSGGPDPNRWAGVAQPYSMPSGARTY